MQSAAAKPLILTSGSTKVSANAERLGSEADTEEREFAFTARDFERICRLIREHAGIALAASKRDMAYSRIARRVRALGMNRFKDYLDYVESAQDESEWTAFVNALTTNLTSFFREPHHFETLAQLLREPRASGSVELWCAASSTGEEPYSMAMVAAEVFGTLRPPVRIVATDIDTQVLQTAQRAVYPLERIERISAERRKRFFQKGTGQNDGLCRVVEGLRAMVEFRPLNLLDSRWPLRGPYRAIFCRNVMIYFDKPTQHRVLQNLVPLLEPDGRLFAGHSESFFHAADVVESCGRTVYRRPRRA